MIADIEIGLYKQLDDYLVALFACNMRCSQIAAGNQPDHVLCVASKYTLAAAALGFQLDFRLIYLLRLKRARTYYR